MSSQHAWIYLVFFLLQYHPADAQGDQCSGLSLSINPDADVKFSVITTIRKPVGDSCSGDISPSAIQNIAAMQWVVDRMNANNFTEGIKIVCQLSLQKSMNVKDHLQIAECLSDLRKQGILIIGSGFATHKGGKPGAPPPAWATAFKEWLHDTLTNSSLSAEDRKKKIMSCLETAPYMDKAHPRIEHFLPLVMCSAVAKYTPGKLLHSEFVMESLLNEHYLF